MGWYDDYYPRYVSVGERRAKAAKKIEKLRKRGVELRPVEIPGRKIAQTFWGKAWCEHLEKFSDYENRLPRGRSYVRGGLVCHLEIDKGKVRAMVAGTSIYNVEVAIKTLPGKKWARLREQCEGRIAAGTPPGEDLPGGYGSNDRPRPGSLSPPERDRVRVRLPRLGGDVQARGGRPLRRGGAARREPGADLPPPRGRSSRPDRQRGGAGGCKSFLRRHLYRRA